MGQPHSTSGAEHVSVSVFTSTVPGGVDKRGTYYLTLNNITLSSTAGPYQVMSKRATDPLIPETEETTCVVIIGAG
jgi:hypothetical protein